MTSADTQAITVDEARYGTALDPQGFSLVEAIERHVERDPWKSHPNHCAHCYYPWPCPTVVLYRIVLRRTP